MTLVAILTLLIQLLLILLLLAWWARWSPRGLAWAAAALLAAAGLSYLSSLIFRVPPYQVGCDGVCPGWRGYPLPTHHILADHRVIFDGASFVRNAFFYYAVLLAYSAIVAWLIRYLDMPQRRWSQWLLFVLAAILIPLASLPLWLPPPQPPVTAPNLRLVNNAARDWRWQLHLKGAMDRRLALEDVRPAPDGKGPRVCFRIYTWFYLPYQRVYIDLDEAGLRARDGREIPLTHACWEVDAP